MTYMCTGLKYSMKKQVHQRKTYICSFLLADSHVWCVPTQQFSALCTENMRLSHVCLALAVKIALYVKGSSAFVIPTWVSKFASTSSPTASVGRSANLLEAATASGVEAEKQLPQALIFDCDGVLADTERDGHRPAFNAAFKIKNLSESHFGD